jgi:AAA domain-containing protein
MFDFYSSNNQKTNPQGHGEEYPLAWQRMLISMLISDQQAWNTCRPHFSAEYFDSLLARAVNFIRDYEAAHGHLPSPEQIKAKTDTDIEKFSEPGQHTDATIKEFGGFARYRAIENSILNGVGLLRDGRLDDVLEPAQQAHDLRVGNEENAFGGLWIDECQTIEPPKFLIKPWLVKGTVTCVYGAPGSFKSFFCLEAAFRLATGTAFAGRSVTKTSVMRADTDHPCTPPAVRPHLRRLKQEIGTTGRPNHTTVAFSQGAFGAEGFLQHF